MEHTQVSNHDSRMTVPGRLLYKLKLRLDNGHTKQYEEVLQSSVKLEDGVG